MKFAAAGTTFDVRDDVVVVGVNPEMADYDNPEGNLFGVAYYVVATNEAGDRRCHFVGSERWAGGPVAAQAARLAAALTARAAKGSMPVGFAAWADDRPAYGSDAYV